VRVQLIPVIVWLALSAPGVRAAAPPTPGHESPGLWVSVFAGGNFGPGWWWLEVTRPSQGRALVRGSEVLQRQLTPDEERTLSRLLAALPQSGKLEFGTAYVDVTTIFQLRVKGSKGWRTYSVTNTLERDARRPEVQPILRLLQFLYGLLGQTDATRPPPPAA
jgi:hypothetical protein